MHIDYAIEQLKGLVLFLEGFRDNRFEYAINNTKKIAFKMEIEPIFREKRVIHRKRKFDENQNIHTILSPEESFRIEYFLYIVDQTISSIKVRFDQFKFYQNTFVSLLSIKALKFIDDNTLKESDISLESFLKHNSTSNIDGFDLYYELKVLTKVIHSEVENPLIL